MKEFCDKENIKIISYYPLIKGANFKKRYEKIMNEKKLDLLNEPVVKDLATKYGKTVGQILRWKKKIMNYYVISKINNIDFVMESEFMVLIFLLK